MLNRIIFYSFALLFFLVPLSWTPLNFELFEYNKMMLVYFLTTIIVGTWLSKSINNKQLNINHTPLDIPLLLFLGANILSTIFSIDHHTSIWGYYSRSNGGLLSTISYTLLYFALVSNINREQVLKLLKFALTGGFLISLWAIFEHFGVSLSCVILRGEFNDGCWVQDVQARVFATLGQPNWLAAYLAMLIFPAFYFIFTATSKSQTIRYTLYAILLYLAFTFTYSRGATLGFLAGLGTFLLFYCTVILRDPAKPEYRRISRLILRFFTTLRITNIKPFFLILIVFLIINLLFGSALTDFKLLSKFAAPTRPTVNLTSGSPSTGTQLENGGTESGQIRLIVWQGALDIFKHYPIFGSGVETFAYSYYNFRPAAHNLVSEWDFLYNKAHNEYLNYLATTGIVGLGTYTLVILIFIVWCLKILNLKFPIFNENLKLKIKNSKPHDLKIDLLIIALLASYLSYLVQNIFSFSVVIIALFFYLFPALVFVFAEETRPLKLSKLLTSHFSLLTSGIYRRSIYTKASKIILVLSTLYLLFSILQIWYADTLFSKGNKAAETGNPGKAYNLLTSAVYLNSNEPLYKNELGFAAASAALALQDSDATLSATLVTEALNQTNISLQISPKNVSFWRTAVRTYYQLASVDKKYTDKTLETLDQAIKLAPTDPKLYYNKAIIFGQIDKNEAAIEALNKAIELRPNYREAYIALGLFYFDKKDFPKALENMRKVLQMIPNDPEVLDHLNQWGKQGIATNGGETR